MDKSAVRRRLRVLVVEDEWLIAAGIADDLHAAGYEVAGPVGSVHEAVGLIETETVDVALLDIHLHGETSFGIADALASRGIPFIFSSGFSRHQIPPTHQSRSLLPKPLDTRLLLEELAAVTVGSMQSR